jgi:hypothetical protein
MCSASSASQAGRSSWSAAANDESTIPLGKVASASMRPVSASMRPVSISGTLFMVLLAGSDIRLIDRKLHTLLSSHCFDEAFGLRLDVFLSQGFV